MLNGIITPVVGGLAINEQVVYVGKYINDGARTVHFGSVISQDYRVLYNLNKNNYAQVYFEILVVNQHCPDK